jgi:PAS domain S-box-containing protein
MDIRIRLRHVIQVGLLVLLTALPVQAESSQGRKQVLIIHSYHSGLTWTDAIMDGIRDAFVRSDSDIQISAEYLDARRYPKSKLTARIRELLLAKLEGSIPDLVMVSDNNALELVLEQRDRLFPDVPVVFCGINDFNPSMVSKHRGITGVAEDVSIIETVNLVLHLHPDTREIVVVGRTSVAADRHNRDSFVAAVPGIPSRLKVSFWDDVPGPELRTRLEKLRSGSVIFINGLITDPTGRQMMYGETTKWISRYSSVPAYSLWDVYLGHGIVGGRLVSGYRQGQMAGQLALQVLGGESADRIPPIAGLDANRHMFDYRQLERFHIPLSRIPGDSIVVNRPDSFYDRYRTLVWATVSVVSALGFLVVLLSIAIVRQRKAERALKLSQEFLSSIIENIPNTIFIKDARDLRFVRHNQAAERLLGYKREDLIGRNDHDFFPEEQADFFAKKDREVLQSGQLLDIPEEAVDTSTGRRILHTQKIPIMDKDGKPAYLLGISEDITELKRAEEEREKLQEQLNQAQKLESVGRLAGGVAHDFNNMLTAILGHAELAMRLCVPSEPIHTSLKAIKESALRSADLVRQLLAFARKQTVAPRVLNVNDTAANMLNMLQRLMGENIELNWVPGQGVWPVRIDPSQLDQLLANLCVNARDAIPGVGRVTIETGNAAFDDTNCALDPGFVPGEYVMLAVSDDGDGIDKNVLDHIFEPFFTTKEPGRGTGLGLSTVYGIVKQNDGFINVYSEPGKGSTFRIYLPRFAGEVGDPAAEGLAEVMKSRGETVLLVEDEATILNVGREMLESLGYKVLTAETPGEALDRAKTYTGDIQLVLTDVVMPEMNGRDLAILLRNIRPGLRCLFASGYTADIIAHQGELDEGVVFIQKPFSIRSLAAKVREALEAGTGATPNSLNG